MSYLVFARKWRPQEFDEVVGQEHITTTLKNAIRLNRVAHAYLFTGPRGIGKTSTARILAKALNCQQGPTVTPCSSCSSCKEIAESRNLDCIEIDGASNRGIEEVRDLRENVRFSPSVGKFKIYIIDEVHMLTADAFNALLKTLEEPPAHVKFIFATTQPHKLPLTISSRCQRFDFRRISINEIIFKLKAISQKEGLKTSEEALFAIARASEGSLRDAEVLLDQLASFCEGKIDAQAVIQVLGVVDQEVLFELTQRIIEKDVVGTLNLLDLLLSEGKEPIQFLNNLIEHFRNLMLAKMGEETKNLIDLPPESIERVFKQSEDFLIEEILYSFQILMSAGEMMKRSAYLRIPLEIALVKLANRENISSLAEILEKLFQLEKKLEEKESVNLTSSSKREDGPPDLTVHRVSEGIWCFSTPHREQSLVGQDKRRHEGSRESLQPQELKDDLSGDSQKSSLTDEAVLREDSQAPLKSILTIDMVNEHWQSLIEKIGTQKISTASYLSEGQPLKVEGRCITIGFPESASFHREALERPESKRLVEKSLAQIFNEEIRVIWTEFDCPQDNTHQDKKWTKDKKNLNTEVEPIVKSALEIFKGRIVQRPKEENLEQD